MTKVLPLSQWKKDPPSEREAFSDEDSDEEDSEYEEILIPKKKDVKRKRGANELSRKFEAYQTKPKIPDSHTKEISAASNAKQSNAKKAASGINGAARTAFWPTSKAIQTESIEALILPFSKIVREGPTVYYCDHVTNVTYKIQCKYPDISFLRRLVENQN